MSSLSGVAASRLWGRSAVDPPLAFWVRALTSRGSLSPSAPPSNARLGALRTAGSSKRKGTSVFPTGMANGLDPPRGSEHRATAEHRLSDSRGAPGADTAVPVCDQRLAAHGLLASSALSSRPRADSPRPRAGSPAGRRPATYVSSVSMASPRAAPPWMDSMAVEYSAFWPSGRFSSAVLWAPSACRCRSCWSMLCTPSSRL